MSGSKNESARFADLHPWGSAVQCTGHNLTSLTHADSVYTILFLILFLLTYVRF